MYFRVHRLSSRLPKYEEALTRENVQWKCTLFSCLLMALISKKLGSSRRILSPLPNKKKTIFMDEEGEKRDFVNFSAWNYWCRCANISKWCLPYSQIHIEKQRKHIDINSLSFSLSLSLSLSLLYHSPPYGNFNSGYLEQVSTAVIVHYHMHIYAFSFFSVHSAHQLVLVNFNRWPLLVYLRGQTAQVIHTSSPGIRCRLRQFCVTLLLNPSLLAQSLR